MYRVFALCATLRLRSSYSDLVSVGSIFSGSAPSSLNNFTSLWGEHRHLFTKCCANVTICLHKLFLCVCVWVGGMITHFTYFSYVNLIGMTHTQRERERPIHVLPGRVCTAPHFPVCTVTKRTYYAFPIFLFPRGSNSLTETTFS